jgi:CspA family cold shock protein
MDTQFEIGGIISKNYMSDEYSICKGEAIIDSNILRKINLNFKNMNTSNSGTVKFFAAAKGYGFITDDKSSKEYFFHVTKTLDEVKTNDLVAFNLEETKRGTVAINVIKRIKN